jgi:8-oxo-dGTP pyrophosphatase MutT (NUDIX family)
MDFKTFVSTLGQKLTQPLPGHKSHLKMMHSERLKSLAQPDSFTRSSAVLLLFYPDQGQIHLPLILRPNYDGRHGGQMALPGGKMEPFDENLSRTALREAQEEIGIKAVDVQVLGELTEVFIPVSNFMVQPVVGFLPYKPVFFPDKREVEKIFEVKYSLFTSKPNVLFKEVKVGKEMFVVPGFEIEEQWVWGATALILNEMLEII